MPCDSEWVCSLTMYVDIRYPVFFHYCIGKNIYFVLLCLQSAGARQTALSDSSISGCARVFLYVSVCICISVSVSCQHGWAGIRFVLFLYWYIMEEFELPWAIIFFISLLVLCLLLLLLFWLMRSLSCFVCVFVWVTEWLCACMCEKQLKLNNCHCLFMLV